MKKNEWTFRYTAKQLAEAATEKISYHDERLEFWNSKREQTIAEIRADGIEVNEKTVIQSQRVSPQNLKGRDWSSGGDVMIRNDLRKSLTETYEKLSYHTARRDQYQGWLKALSDNPENSHDLDMDDWQFFFGKDVAEAFD